MEHNEIEFGLRVRIQDLPGEWIVQKINDDGSVCCYGGPVYRKAFRDFPVERLQRKDSK